MSDIFDDVEKLIAEENALKAQEEATAVAEPAMEVEASAASESEVVTEEEQIFNESELEDIMAEIESLENDFSTPEIAIAGVVVEDSGMMAANVETAMESMEESHHTPEELRYDSSRHSKTDLQLEIEREIALIDEKLIASTTDDSVETSASVESVVVAPVVSEVVGVKEEIPEMESTVIAFEKKASPQLVSSPVVESSTGKKEMSFTASGAMAFTLNVNVGSEVAKLYIDETKGLVINMSGVEVCLNDVTGCSVTMENGINFNIPLTSKENNSKKKTA